MCGKGHRRNATLPLTVIQKKQMVSLPERPPLATTLRREPYSFPEVLTWPNVSLFETATYNALPLAELVGLQSPASACCVNAAEVLLLDPELTSALQEVSRAVAVRGRHPTSSSPPACHLPTSPERDRPRGHPVLPKPRSRVGPQLDQPTVPAV